LSVVLAFVGKAYIPFLQQQGEDIPGWRFKLGFAIASAPTLLLALVSFGLFFLLLLLIPLFKVLFYSDSKIVGIVLEICLVTAFVFIRIQIWMPLGRFLGKVLAKAGNSMNSANPPPLSPTHSGRSENAG